jgi:hypothetical protein
MTQWFTVTNFFLVFLMTGPAFAAPASIDWPARSSKVVCGGSADGTELAVRVSVPNEVLAAETADGRVLVYIDLHKPGQVRWVMNEGMSDADYDQRQALIAKLSPEEAELVKKISASQQTDLYTGLTVDGFVHLDRTSGKLRLSLSCQENKI